ncbi:Gp37 family protein [uncultured Tateyamaria sp.]|uniref:Gp37 family protein n=1 Tax=uncultured Tateyamaria sp. TaxID=455651 RepID=UPI0026387AFD|nr:Gp37 family protein [uncultured Tateyamaria sp.]
MSTKLKPTQLEKIEAGIVALLKDNLGAGYLIDIFPDRPGDFDMGKANKAALVQYTGSTYAAPDGTKSGWQQRSPSFAVHLQLRTLGYAMRGTREVEQVRFALQAANIEGAELRLVRDGIADQDEHFWRYVIEVACTIPAVPRPKHVPAPLMTDFQKEGA